jgi:hypothetical protein
VNTPTTSQNINYNDNIQQANTPTNKSIAMNNVTEGKNKFQNSQTQTQTQAKTHPKKTNEKFYSIKEQNATAGKSRYHNSYKSASLIEDFQMLYLIDNCKRIEKIIEKEKPIGKIEKIEEKIVKNIKVVDEIKRDETRDGH